jgi:hypothetical protein
MNQKICYVYSPELINQCNRIPVLKNRVSTISDILAQRKFLYCILILFYHQAAMVHELIASHQLLDHLYVKPPREATYEELLLFHSSLYVDCLIKNQKPEKSNNSDDPDDSDSSDEESRDCGLGMSATNTSNFNNFNNFEFFSALFQLTTTRNFKIYTILFVQLPEEH